MSFNIRKIPEVWTTKYTCQLTLFSLNEIITRLHWHIYLSVSPIILLNFCFSEIMSPRVVKSHNEEKMTYRLIFFPVKWFIGHNSRSSLKYKNPSNVNVEGSHWLHQDSKLGRNRTYSTRMSHKTVKVSVLWLCPEPASPGTAKNSTTITITGSGV